MQLEKRSHFHVTIFYRKVLEHGGGEDLEKELH